MFRLVCVAFSACCIVACSNQSPVAPEGFPASGNSLAARGSTGVPGVYALSFFARVPSPFGAFQEVSSLPVLTAELILKALVTDSSGNPATLGTVNFEYCSYGGRTNDITQPDEAPKEACDQGQAKWARLGSWQVDVAGGNCLALGSGSACYPFGNVRTPRTIGFRFRYAQQKGSIASGVSPARNFEWTAQLP